MISRIHNVIHVHVDIKLNARGSIDTPQPCLVTIRLAIFGRSATELLPPGVKIDPAERLYPQSCIYFILLEITAYQNAEVGPQAGAFMEKRRYTYHYP